MFKKLILVFLVFGVTFLAGCASVPLTDQNAALEAKAFHSPSDGNAALYIYRDSFVGQALKKDVWVDGKCVGQTSNKTFFYIEVDGDKEHLLSTESEFSPNDLKLFAEAGKNYFIRQNIKMGVFVGGAGLEQIPEEEAKKVIPSLNLALPGTCSGALVK